MVENKKPETLDVARKERLFAEAHELRLKNQEREGSAKGSVKRRQTEDESQSAHLAHLLELALADEELDQDVKEQLRNAFSTPLAKRGNIGLLAREVAPLATSLNLEPALLALILYHQAVQNREKAPAVPAGLEDWFGLSDRSQELRTRILAQTRELAADLEFSVGQLNEDVETCIALAIRKSVDIKVKLEVLKKKVAAEFGRRRKLFHHYSRRDLEAFYLRRMRGLPPSDPRILALFNEARLDLTIKENRDRVKRYASDRISEVANRMNKITEHA